MSKLAKILGFFAVFALAVSTAKPAKAFYIELPQILKNLLATSNQTSAQEQPMMGTYNTTMPPQDGGTYQQPMQTYQPMPNQTYNQPQPIPDYQQGPTYGPGTSNPGPTCNVNGVEMTGSCDLYNNNQQGSMPSGDYNQGPGPDDTRTYGPSPEEQKKNEARQLKDMKRGIKQSERQVKEFERMIQKAEKSGTVIPEEVKQKFEMLKSIVNGAKNANSMEEMQNIDMGEMGEIMQSLDESRREIFEKAERLAGMKRGMKGMEQGLKMFEKQVARLAKSKIAVPAKVTEDIAKLKAFIEQIKNAKTTEEMDAIDFDSMQDMWQTLDEDRQQMEQLVRWPQTLKEINRQLSQMQREVKRAKTIADRLGKKGMDVMDLYNAFAEAVNKMKSVRDSAVEKMASGDAEGAFDLIENEFFGQMEDVWQHFKVLSMMSNMGQFNSQFKKEMAQAQLMIKKLKKKGVDTSELEELYARAKEKGQEIQTVIKSKDFDEDSIREAFEEMENLGQEFDDKMADLTGEKEDMPWEKGPQQFRKIKMNKDVQKFMPQRREGPSEREGEMNGSSQPMMIEDNEPVPSSLTGPNS